MPTRWPISHSVRKYDAHVHVQLDDAAFLEQARADGFELMSINVDYPGFPQRWTCSAKRRWRWRKADPQRFHWATTFSMHGFGKPGWAERRQRGPGARRQAGRARGQGLEERRHGGEAMRTGKLIMLDNSALSPVAEKVRGTGTAP